MIRTDSISEIILLFVNMREWEGSRIPLIQREDPTVSEVGQGSPRILHQLFRGYAAMDVAGEKKTVLLLNSLFSSMSWG